MSEDYQAPSGAGLSPAAQAVLDAVEDHGKFHYGSLAAAALRAAADQCAEDATHWALYAIADELEGSK